MEPATFRPRVRRLGPQLLLGGAAGGLVGVATGIPPLLAFLFGAVAASLASSARHAAGLRVVADERGVRVRGGAGPDGAWAELRVGTGLAQRADGLVQRYAVFADARGRTFAFADVGAGAPFRPIQGADGAPVALVELRDAPLLLALLVERAPAWFLLPEPLREAPPPPSAAEPARGPAPEPAPARLGPRRGERGGVGLVGLVAKLGSKLLAGAGKIGAGAAKAAKSAKVGWALASAGTYALLFSWKFALAILVQLFVHEYGHVHAMRRTGMKVRGMYFVPLLGAVAVTEDAFTSRRQQAYVALAGPVWGSLLALLPAALFWSTGEPIWAAIAAWWALLNLFNLLPIAPLDGGRVMQAFAFSFSSGVGVAVSVLGLVAAIALATWLGFGLVWFVAALGAMEFASEAQARAGARALRLLPEPARLGPAQWVHLRGLVGTPGSGAGDALFLRTLERTAKGARAEPMRPGQLARWGLAYAALALGLALLVWSLRGVPGAEAASRLLQ